ncbi:MULTISPECIES: class I SAM-dependent methyltransferase [Bacillus]|uniref:class I SAM-dependent methyltransferase n=1 Tax=Bacillus TaxID=1386 RepID=UPI0022430888|nr:MULTISPECIES: class I SAM-dependent methyltransferase [Bacillus]MDN5388454.1 class I SAM-dependent methyltransferase [Bacillus sp. LB7]MEC1023184.1 class I SAM-dependent methyltransferase [Bacillus paralicheniformis]MEC1025750.1 class I SAM-dependent methyltransferase [Bacillus paralicheniformis]MEC1035834.1 class I SAM-dependent methyltransferase [Bacillus paralicheniformis]MEC1050028.1 class I SAM-dependent methyltransferase [Bacillus paralicheniformis]
MLTLTDFKDVIEQQVRHNQSQSLFYEFANGRLALSPSKETTDFLKRRSHDIVKFLQQTHEAGTLQLLANDMSDQTIQLFIKVNQYLDFSRQDYRRLQKMYSDLLKRVYLMGKQEEISNQDIEQLFSSHYKNLQTFLLDSNGEEIFKKYKENPNVFAVECSEYTSDLQMRLFNINLSAIKTPLLDIGCGQQASLVRFLRKNAVESYGIDRNVENIAGLHKANWFEYKFTPNTWGTIISHMAFSNHFIHHHLRLDGDYKKYAEKYMEILKSLKLGGSFIYAPSLPFIEQVILHADRNFIVKNMQHATKVIRVK